MIYYRGGGGADTYVFGRGYGHDVIDDKQRSYSYNNYGPGGGADEVSFLAGVSPADVSVHRRGDYDLEVRVAGTSDMLTIRDFFSQYGLGNGAIERFRFAGGTVWDLATICEKAQHIYEPTRIGEPVHSFTGYDNQSDIIHGSSGDDVVYTGNKADTVYAGGGNDTVTGGWGNDILYGEAGNDTLSGGYRNSEGYSWEREPDDDVLDGGTGDDLLIGGGGDDTYVFGRGYGHDVIDDRHRTYEYNHYGSGGAHDTILFGTGISPSDVLVRRQDYSDLKLSISGTDDTLTIRDFFYSYTSGIGYGAIEQVKFADGTTWDLNMLREKARYIYGTDDSDTLTGYYGQDNIIVGGAGDDKIGGNNSNDIIDGGSGNDLLYGGTGDDTYVFGRGYGRDTIHDYGASGWGIEGGGNDTIALQAGIAPEDVVLRRVGNNVEMTLVGTADMLTIRDYFSSGAYAIEAIEFVDGTTWDAQQIRQRATIMGTAGSDALYGTNDGHTFDGGAGNDYLRGGRGSDTYLFGRGYGVDSVYDADNTLGVIDTVKFLADVSPSDVKVVRSGENLELQIVDTSDKLVVNQYFTRYNDGTNTQNMDGNKVERVIFGDGTIWSMADVMEKARDIIGTDAGQYMTGFDDQNDRVYAGGGNDFIITYGGDDEIDAGTGGDYVIAGYGNDKIWGGDGDDTLLGNAGDDILDGGMGNDRLNGEQGNDTYMFGRGDGQDIISDVDTTLDNADVIQLREGLTPEDMIVKRSGDNLILAIRDTNDTLTIERFFSHYCDGVNVGEDGNKIEFVRFTDGSSWG
jgi:Ca2+-binding RTX toxin-like protein